MRARFPRLLAVFLLLAMTARAEFRVWTNSQGRTVEAEYVSATTENVKLRLRDNSMADYSRGQLSAADQAYLAARMKGAAIPSTTPAGVVAAALGSKLVALKGPNLITFDSKALAGVKYYAIYYSAGWCGPCHAFTPSLVSFYQQHKAAHPEFEVIFASDDHSEEDMRGYMAEMNMPWPAVRFNQTELLPLLKKHAESGIPNLVLLDAAGTVLAKSFEGENYVGPTSVLNELGRRLEADGQ